ncbi:MAG: hypothetical protein JO051_03425 [Acidobacteriaceae bacterium]|nr:hypothetical protein [Acidobacteriaceae bacterium]
MTLKWNSSDAGSDTQFANGDRDFLHGVTSGTWNSARSTDSKSSGKWYVEITIPTAASSSTPNAGIGFGDSSFNVNSYLGSADSAGLIFAFPGSGFVGGILAFTTAPPSGDTVSAADIYMMALDLDNGKAYLGKNGSWFSGMNPAAGTGPWVTWTPSGTGPWFVAATQNGNSTCTLRLAAGNTYSAPSGFTVWNDSSGANLAAAQTLGALGQTATLSGADNLAAAQTLGGIGQTTTGGVVVSATASQTLGALVETITGGVVDAATVIQALPAIGQLSVAGVLDQANAAQTLGALGQNASASTGNVSNIAASQVLGALGQVASAAVPEAGLAAQVLGALSQVAAGTVSEALVASQTLGGLGQTATIYGAAARNIHVGPDFAGGDFSGDFTGGPLLPGIGQAAGVTTLGPPPTQRVVIFTGPWRVVAEPEPMADSFPPWKIVP